VPLYAVNLLEMVEKGAEKEGAKRSGSEKRDITDFNPLGDS
jgi:hypothetical protein